MEPLRRSTRVRRSVGTRVEAERPQPIKPCFEEAEQWLSPLPPCRQIRIHGELPEGNKPQPCQTNRGTYVAAQNRTEVWATIVLESRRHSKRTLPQTVSCPEPAFLPPLPPLREAVQPSNAESAPASHKELGRQNSAMPLATNDGNEKTSMQDSPTASRDNSPDAKTLSAERGPDKRFSEEEKRDRKRRRTMRAMLAAFEVES